MTDKPLNALPADALRELADSPKFRATIDRIVDASADVELAPAQVAAIQEMQETNGPSPEETAEFLRAYRPEI